MIYIKGKNGFTLIELIIAIALLGALAVGLLAALDPFEQFRKASDTGVRNTVSELYNAISRYYAVRQRMPWCKDAECNNRYDSLTAAPNGKPANTLQNTINEMSDLGELKSDFYNTAKSQLSKIYITGKENPPEVIVCYQPLSKAFQKDPNTKYVDEKGTEDTAQNQCKTYGGPNNCYWCIK